MQNGKSIHKSFRLKNLTNDAQNTRFQQPKKQSENILKNVFGICDETKNNPIVFLSTELRISEFECITNKKVEHLVYDFTEKTECGEYLNASITLPLHSLLFIDFPDKSLYRTDEGFLDIQHIRKMIISLKYKYNVKDIYIDNFHQVSCYLMGRNLLWEPKSLADVEDWKDRQMEYKLSLLFYMSRKFDLNFYIGMKLLENVEKPKYIKHLTFGNSFDMIDEIQYNYK